MPWFHLKKKRMANELIRSQSNGLSCVGRDAGSLSEIHAKTDQHCRAEDCFAIDMEWFATEVHWQRNPVISIVCCCSWWTFWTRSLNTERADEIHHWNVWTVDEKVVQSLIRYYWICRTRLYVHLKKWTLKFKLLYLLNHIVILIKFAGYVAWILACKHCKFGDKICYSSRDIELFLGDYFFSACALYIVQSKK